MESIDNARFGKLFDLIEAGEKAKAVIVENNSLRRENATLREELRKQEANALVHGTAPQQPSSTQQKPETPAQNAPAQSEHQATGKVEVFILEPEAGKLCTVENWKKDSDPNRAEWVAIRNEKGEAILLHKNGITVDGNPEIKFDKANEAAAAFVSGGHTGSRKDWIDVYEAIHTAGLNDALKLIGGEPIKKEWYWTKEKDSDQSYAYYAWIFNGNYGYLLYGNVRIYASYARVFRAFGVETL